MVETPNRKRPFVWIGVGIGAAVAIMISAVYMLTSSDEKKNSNLELSANDQDITVTVFPPNSKPYGKTYGEWNQLWWEWAQSEPIESNPVFDPTGEDCGVNQDDPDVWYLAGSTGGTVERTCTVPSSKAIFFPLLNTECSTAEDRSLTTEEALRDCARNNAPDRARVILKASVDGQDIPNLMDYWTESSLYDYTLINKNIWGAPAGPTQQVAAGYYVMIEPLTLGEHVIQFSGANIDLAGSQTFATEAIYHLTVVEE